MYFSSDCFLESVGNCQPEKFVESRKIFKVSPHFGVSVPYFHGGYSEGHFEVLALSSRGSTKSERYQSTTNEKPSETMFQRVLLDFVLKTFGLGAENEPRARIRGHSRERLSTPPTPLVGGTLGSLVANLVFRSKRSLPYQREVWRDCIYGRGLFRETHKKSNNLSIAAVRQSGKRNSSPRFACAVSRTIFTPPTPERGDFGVAS